MAESLAASTPRGAFPAAAVDAFQGAQLCVLGVASSRKLGGCLSLLEGERWDGCGQGGVSGRLCLVELWGRPHGVTSRGRKHRGSLSLPGPAPAKELLAPWAWHLGSARTHLQVTPAFRMPPWEPRARPGHLRAWSHFFLCYLH